MDEEITLNNNLDSHNLPSPCFSDYPYSIVNIGNDKYDALTKPLHFEVFVNFPNPFNNTTRIQTHLNKSQNAKITIYNVKGQFVKTIYSGWLQKGRFESVWDGTNQNGKLVCSGMYFCEIELDNQKSRIRMVFSQ